MTLKSITFIKTSTYLLNWQSTAASSGKPLTREVRHLKYLMQPEMISWTGCLKAIFLTSVPHLSAVAAAAEELVVLLTPI